MSRTYNLGVPLELLDTPRLHAQLLGLERRTACGGRDSIDHAPGAHDDVANAVAGALAGRTRVAGSGAAHVLPPTAASPPRRGSRSRSRALTKDMGERLAPRPPSAARPRTPWNRPLLDFPRVPFLQTLGHRDRIRREHGPEGPQVHELPKAGCPTSDQSGS